MDRIMTPLLTLLMTTGGAAAAGPAALAPPEGARLLLSMSAKGVQIYTCQKSEAGFAWVFNAPEAELLIRGRAAGKHFAGPSWQARDGSLVTGEVVAKADAPASNAIPWLLLRAKSHEGKGKLETVGFIQRIDTKGGIAPAAGCDAAHAGAQARVPYSARYLFYAAPR